MLQYIEKNPTPEEFNCISQKTGNVIRDNEILKEAFEKTLYSVSVYDGDKIIGCGRLVGDKTMVVYLQSIMVVPEYQRQGIGTEIINRLIQKVKEYKEKSPELRCYLFSYKGKEKLYEKFGFISRPNDEYGAGMMYKWK